jgi:hypothetical protein
LIEVFLETAAPCGANVVLVFEIAMGIGLLLGAPLARKRRFRQHACCQSAIVLLNLVVVVVMVIPSFRFDVLPRVPAKLALAEDSTEFSKRIGIGQVTKLSVLPRLELFLQSEPLAISQSNDRTAVHEGEVFAGVQSKQKNLLLLGRGWRLVHFFILAQSPPNIRPEFFHHKRGCVVANRRAPHARCVRQRLIGVGMIGIG